MASDRGGAVRGGTIREWPADHRPRERLAALRAGALSAQELLAVVVGSGGAAGSAMKVAGELLRRFGGSLRRVGSAETGELQSVPGIGPARAAAVAAAFELGRRMAAEGGRDRRRVSGPRDVQRRLGPALRDRRQEEFWALYLDTQNRVLVERKITVGLLNASLVHPREVFAPALAHGAASLVIAHNHPSGDPEPSTEDVEVTRQLAASGALLGIPLRDHVVLGDGRYVSLRERGWVDEGAAAGRDGTAADGDGTAAGADGAPGGARQGRRRRRRAGRSS